MGRRGEILSYAAAGVLGLSSFALCSKGVRAEELQDLYLKERGEEVSLTGVTVIDISRDYLLGEVATLEDGPNGEPGGKLTGADCLLERLNEEGQLNNFSKGKWNLNALVDQLDGEVIYPYARVSDRVTLSPIVHLRGVQYAGVGVPCTDPTLSEQSAEALSRTWSLTKNGLSGLEDLGENGLRKFRDAFP